ncbi:hypothetical protein Nepgr_010581 [Nepenthes gracilis]|uniref:Uncharacterized protein n=1 Tax=Nepenthes gracilis TaxID=150966 RepID=A0AAD3SDF0_NEPGR|nr:hypothetical protein Nepgr_010581 [Nepenthes gracilis]
MENNGLTGSVGPFDISSRAGWKVGCVGPWSRLWSLPVSISLEHPKPDMKHGALGANDLAINNLPPEMEHLSEMAHVFLLIFGHCVPASVLSFNVLGPLLYKRGIVHAWILTNSFSNFWIVGVSSEVGGPIMKSL